MTRKLLLLAGAIFVLTPAGADAQTAESILSEAASRQEQRWEPVRNYAIEELVAGMPGSAPGYFVRDEGVPDQVVFRKVPASEWGGDAGPAGGAGGPNIPFDLGLVGMAPGGAAYSSNADPETMAALTQRARLLGEETVDGRRAFHLRADDLSDLASDVEVGDPESESEFTLRAASLWFDAEEYVPLRTRLELEVESDGQTAPAEIELRLEGYEQVGPLYEPTRQVVRMTGIQALMAAGQDQEDWEETQRELAEAREQLAQIQAQMDQIPEAMRGMMQSQLDRYIEQIEMMENEGAIETVIQRRVISVNEGPPTDWNPALTPGGEAP